MRRIGLGHGIGGRSAVLGSAVLALLAGGAAGQDDRFNVIVNSSNPVSQITRKQIAPLFLSRLARWRDRAADPVDQSLHSGIREAFSREILRQPTSAVRRGWEDRMRTSRELPPPVRESDEEVIAYVARRGGAIGYVSGSAVLPPSVKVVAIVD